MLKISGQNFQEKHDIVSKNPKISIKYEEKIATL